MERILPKLIPRLSRLAAIIACVVGPAVAANTDLREVFQRPAIIPFPNDAPYSREIATLGKMLFFDPRLSGAQNMSCASCHSPSFGWEAPVALSIGAMNQPLTRHAPTLINMAWVSPYFWDGRAETLEEQAIGPITAKEEMNATFDMIIARLSEVKEYKTHFERLFPGKGISRYTILRAIATYERTIVSGISRFDRWVDGDETALSLAEKRGFDLFVGEAACSECHQGWNFTNNEFYDTGLPSQHVEDRIKFKTPGLRNISLRAPFMHNGSLATLEDVVRHYVSGGAPGLDREPDVRALEISEDEIEDLVAFLTTLTEEQNGVRSPVLPGIEYVASFQETNAIGDQECHCCASFDGVGYSSSCNLDHGWQRLHDGAKRSNRLERHIQNGFPRNGKCRASVEDHGLRSGHHGHDADGAR